MPNKVEQGMRGQYSAEDYLSRKGYTVLARNYRIPSGEIDLIMRDGAYIVFIEVKFRSSLRYGYPREAVNSNKQRHIKKTALHYIMINHLNEQDFRFDVVEVLHEDGNITVTHIENAFC